MNGLLFSLPGTPVIYYGDEIGMGDNIYLGDRNGVRTPMQWSRRSQRRLLRRQPAAAVSCRSSSTRNITTRAINVEAQQNNPHSLLWWMKRLIALRKRYRAFGRGSLEFLSPGQPQGAGLRPPLSRTSASWSSPTSRASPQYVELDLPSFAGHAPRRAVRPHGVSGHRPVAVHAHAGALRLLLVLRGAASRRDRPGTSRRGPIAGDRNRAYLGHGVPGQRPCLPGRLAARLSAPAATGFTASTGRSRRPCSSRRSPFRSETDGAEIALVQVEFSEGEAETYVLPLAFATGNLRTEIESQLPEAIVARLRIQDPARDDASSVEGILFDPTGEKSFSSALIEAIRRGRRFKRAGGEIVGITFPSLRRVAATD